jgi:glyoxylate carboligase
MVSFLIDAVDSHDVARNYTFYNEQGAGFAASGLTQATGKVSVAYATSGPGATNLVTTIAHNFFDLYPVFYITGNVSKSHSLEKLNIKHTSKIRQHGFQELDIVKLTKLITGIFSINIKIYLVTRKLGLLNSLISKLLFILYLNFLVSPYYLMISFLYIFRLKFKLFIQESK